MSINRVLAVYQVHVNQRQGGEEEGWGASDSVGDENLGSYVFLPNTSRALRSREVSRQHNGELRGSTEELAGLGSRASF